MSKAGIMDTLFGGTTFGVGSGHWVYYKRGLATKRYGGKVHGTRDSIQQLVENANVKKLTRKYKKDISKMSLSRREISNRLATLAAQEREKESRVLMRLDPTKKGRYNQMGDAKFINKLNEFLGMGDKYKVYLKYIHEVYPNPKLSAKNMSPMVTSYFNNYFSSILNNSEFIDKIHSEILRIVEQGGTKKEVIAASKEVGNWIAEKFMEDNANNNLVDTLFEKIEGTNTKKLDEQYHFWKDLFEKIKKDEAVRNEFMESVLKSYNLGAVIYNAVIGVKKQIKDKKSIDVKKAFTTSTKTKAAQKGGLYAEAVAAALQVLNLESLGGRVMGTSRLSDRATTDSVVLYTGELTVEINNELTKRFDELLTKPLKDKTRAIEAVTDFTSWVQENVNKGILVYSSAKSYKLTRLSTGENFFQGGRRKITEMGDLLFLQGGTMANAESFIDLIINTIPGAINDDQQEEIKLSLSHLMAQNIANLLFDDWETIGFDEIAQEGNADVIHVFPLSGVLVPLSYLLSKAADAFKKAEIDMVLQSNNYFRINFDLPDTIHFIQPQDTTAFINNYQKEKLPESNLAGLDADGRHEAIKNVRLEGLKEAWKVQSEEALSKTQFGVDFLSNFNDLLAELNQLMA